MKISIPRDESTVTTDKDPDEGRERNDARAPGWKAIEEALYPIYHGIEQFHYGTVLPYGLGGEDPLQGISVYHRVHPAPHFHYVTFGFSDLWGEAEPGAEWSGYGFELTFRLACAAEKGEPPLWPIGLMQNLAKYVFKTGNVFQDGHHIKCNGPIRQDDPTELGFLAFTHDRELPPRDTSQGKLEFLQIVGLCQDEYETIKVWRTDRFLAILERQYPLLITDLRRGSILMDEGIAQEVEAGYMAEGSGQAAIYADLHVDIANAQARISIGANAIGDLLLMLDHRVAHGHECAVHGESAIVRFLPADASAWAASDGKLTVHLSPDLRAEMRRTLRIERGTYRWEQLPGITLEVTPTEIKDDDGNVVGVIG
jgi:suppressor of fused-like protein